MGIKGFYEEMGQDWEPVLNRMMGSEELLWELLKAFLQDGTLLNLRQAVSAGLEEEVFCQSHTLKGLALNLGLKPLSEAAGVLVEQTRNQNGAVTDEEREAFCHIEEAYGEVTARIRSAVLKKEDAS